MERFWAKVERGENCDCWLWRGARNNGGYGQLAFEGKTVLAHRLALALFVEPSPGPEYLALHKCDVPSCVNPRHLYWGTQLQNSRDMISRGRRASFRGEKHGRSKLQATEVLQIRSARSRGEATLKVLAERYGVSQSLIRQIVNREIWIHL